MPTHIPYSFTTMYPTLLGKKLVLLSTVVCALSVIGLVGCSKKTANNTTQHKKVWVTVVGQGNGGNVQTFNGTFVPRKQTALSFRASGKVVARMVEVGDRVHAGQIIGKLDGSDYTLARETARQQVVALETAAQQAARDEARLKQLVQDGTVSRAEYEQLSSRRIANDAQVEGAKQQLALQNNRLNYLTLVAPSSGVISSIQFEVGQLVGEGQPIAMVSDEGEMELAVDVPAHIAKEIPVWTASASLWSNISQANHIPASIALKLRTVSPIANVAGQTFTAKYTLLGLTPQQKSSFSQGLSAQVTLQKAGENSTFHLPSNAVLKTKAAEAPFVWIVEQHKPVRQPIHITAYHSKTVSVQGLTSGQQVVSVGAQKITPDMLLDPIPRESTH